MTEVLRVLAAIVLAAHGLVHLLYLLPAEGDPRYPFALHRLSVLPVRWRRPAGAVLASIVVVAALALGLAVAGVPGLGAEWPALALATAISSLLLVALVRDRRLIVGAILDVALLVLVVLHPDAVVP